MASLGVFAPWMRAALHLLLLILPACVGVCPRSCSCPNPKEVHCTFRHLSSFPRNLPKDTVRFNLGYNSIVAVGTTDFGHLHRLEMLMLHGNEINTVASGSFYQLRSLQILKLSYNKLTKVDPSMFDGLTGLVRLHLDHNLINFIEPFSFNGLTSLRLLQLESNRLQDLHPHTFTTISLLGTFWGSGLRHLYLADNQLEYLLPGTFQHLTKLEVLSLHNNPWICDCQLLWLLEWEKKHEGVIKCKKEQDSEICAVCASPQSFNNSHIFQLSAKQLSCDRPSLESPLKLGEYNALEDQEPDLPYTKDLERPMGHLAFMLSDSHENRAHVACDVNRPIEGTSMLWEKLKRSDEVTVNVTLTTVLECEIDREALQNLWRLVAYYYESPAILERGARHENTSKVTFQYSQVTSEDSPYFTELKGHLMAEPAWLLQPRVTIQLNRRKTTTKKLVMNFSTFISKLIFGRGEKEDRVASWALIPRGTPGRIQMVLEHTEAIFDCNIQSSGQLSVEWMLPDLTILDKTDSVRILSDHNRLIIKNTSLSDTGVYHCFVRTETEVDMVSYRLMVRERLLSPSDLNGKKMSVENGESLSLPCSVSSPKPMETRWLLPNHQFLMASSAEGRIYVAQNNTLIIKHVTNQDSGEYSCLAANLHGTDMLSHLVVITGEEEEVLTDVSVIKGESFLYDKEDAEGSGYHEIKQLAVTQIPPKVTEKDRSMGRIRQGFRWKKIKEKGRNQNKSVKQLGPGHWAQMLAKANAKVSTIQPATTRTYTNRIPVWPRVHGSNHHSSLDKPLHYLHTRGRYTGYTNQPDITAQTANPTPYIPWSVETSMPKSVVPHDGLSKVRDYLLFNRLRNRYRQSKLGAHNLAQSGRLVTLKPRTYKPTSKLQPFPNFPSIYKPVTPPSIIATSSKPYTTASIQYGSRWHYSNFGPQKLSTALPFPNLMGDGVKPKIMTIDPATVSALAETNVLLRCQATGDPKPVISWTKVSTGATIQASTKHGQRFEVLPNGSFVIKNVQLQDRGQYLCSAQNKFGSDRMVVALTVQTEPPKIDGPKYRDISVYLGKPVSLDCIAAGKPQAQVSWILPDKTILRDSMTLDKPISLFPNGTLSISSANFSIKGNYKCLASNAAGADTLIYQVHVAALPPTIKEESFENININTGKNIYVHCTAKGEPEPYLKWVLPDGSQLKPTQYIERRLFIFPNGTLYIKSIVPVDAGRYECTASNLFGFAQRVVNLDIKQETPGQWNGPSQQHSVSAMYGSTVFLHCPESADYHRGTVWRLPSRTLLDHHYSPDRHINAFSNGTLRILQLTEKDQGSYLCMYQRPNGEDMELFELKVLMKPPKIENMGNQQKKVANGENFFVDCVASGLPFPEVSWSLPDGTMLNNALQSDDSGTRIRRYIIFDNGTLLLPQMGTSDEGDYTCYAKNTLGEDAMKVSVQVVQNAPQISLKDQVSLHIPLGQSAQLKCDATGEPPPAIIWISPNNEMINLSSVKYQILRDGTLIINNVNLADQGKYTCVARNSAGDDIKNVKLHIALSEPYINGNNGRTDSKVLSVSYQTVLMHCKAHGMPEPLITWTTSSGISLPTPYVGGRFQVHKNGTLELRGIRKTDEGKYLCVARNNVGEASLAINLEVALLAEKPSFPIPNIEVIALKPDGDDITLQCQAVGKPKPEFVWILPNSTMLVPGNKLKRFIHSKENGSLHIIQPVPSDKGVYRCLAKNVAGQAEKRYALELGRKPQIRGTPTPMKISFGQTLNMPCTVEGWPQATITWTLPNGLVLDRPQVVGRVTFQSNGTLQLREAAKSDRGTYICKATNTFGTSTLSYPVTIMVLPPQITNAPPSIIKVNKGSPVTLRCIATGTPKPDISWTLPGRTTLVPNNRFTSLVGIHMTEDGSLVIQDPSLMHSGIYKCNAKNALGMDFKATYLQVN
ncbi:Matrix-remodeling-associated protein 5 [Bagarius yarrelli]|uniref:Matrix-remodeling-associated protein 5 n=1 Tax=Bagarius yarrelli TaxID=175774 RepID=A0A556V3U6_BAGYA|nr:Matrix-remodeling-associated protein 5 [Bagarius yarrelli]